MTDSEQAVVEASEVISRLVYTVRRLERELKECKEDNVNLRCELAEANSR